MGGRTVTVRAPNWIAALGLSYRALGLEPAVGRMACEVLPNGTVLVNESGNRRRCVLRRLSAAEEAA